MKSRDLKGQLLKLPKSIHIWVFCLLENCPGQLRNTNLSRKENRQFALLNNINVILDISHTLNILSFLIQCFYLFYLWVRTTDIMEYVHLQYCREFLGVNSFHNKFLHDFIIMWKTNYLCVLYKKQK